MKKLSIIFFITALLILSAGSVFGNDIRYSPDIDVTPGRLSVISMVTVYPGDEVYSLFGHSSFRVYDSENGIDWMYNYGTFDFSDPLFVPKFISGRLDYYLDVNRFQSSLRFYSAVEDRKVVEQVLNLEYEERVKLFNFLQHNAKPENRFYRYDFIQDNCSTRIADGLEAALGADFTDYSQYNPPPRSFRSLIREYLKARPYTDFGIQLLLGRGADKVPEGNEIFFLPIPMMDAFDSALRKIKPGTMVPQKLAADTLILNKSGRIAVDIPDWPLIHFSFLLAAYTGVIFLTRYFASRKKRKRRLSFIRNNVIQAKSILETLFLLFSGFAGILLFYLWFISDHSVTKYNLNILWLTPLSLVLFYLYVSGRSKKTAAVLSILVFLQCAAFLALTAAGLQSVHTAAYPLVLALMATVIGRFYSPASGKISIKEHWKRIS